MAMATTTTTTAPTDMLGHLSEYCLHSDLLLAELRSERYNSKALLDAMAHTLQRDSKSLDIVRGDMAKLATSPSNQLLYRIQLSTRMLTSSRLDTHWGERLSQITSCLMYDDPTKKRPDFASVAKTLTSGIALDPGEGKGYGLARPTFHVAGKTFKNSAGLNDLDGWLSVQRNDYLAFKRVLPLLGDPHQVFGALYEMLETLSISRGTLQCDTFGDLICLHVYYQLYLKLQKLITNAPSTNPVSLQLPADDLDALYVGMVLFTIMGDRLNDRTSRFCLLAYMLRYGLSVSRNSPTTYTATCIGKAVTSGMYKIDITVGSDSALTFNEVSSSNRIELGAIPFIVPNGSDLGREIVALGISPKKEFEYAKDLQEHNLTLVNYFASTTFWEKVSWRKYKLELAHFEAIVKNIKIFHPDVSIDAQDLLVSKTIKSQLVISEPVAAADAPKSIGQSLLDLFISNTDTVDKNNGVVDLF